MTVAERIDYYHNIIAELERVEEEEIPNYSKGAERKVAYLYGEARQILSGLRSDLKTEFSGTRVEENGKKTRDGLTKRLYKSLSDEQIDNFPPPPDTAPPLPVSEWSSLQWGDNVVRWGLLIVGLCLLGGLLTRPMCVVGALFLLLFFVAMPPLPGWPDNPRAEGHYLFINKNIIEMLALLVLATTATGRWFGLDGLLQFLNPFRSSEAVSSKPPAANSPPRKAPQTVKVH
jgi:uncharacterized membrane protein YphA (DoxX/SURF4 family)